jgi:hypothetical protein
VFDFPDKTGIAASLKTIKKTSAAVLTKMFNALSLFSTADLRTMRIFIKQL